MNNNCDIWFELANLNQSVKRFCNSKSFYQNIAKRNSRYFNRFLSKQSSAYHKQNRKKLQNVEITIKMKNIKNSNDREFDQNNRNKNYDKKDPNRVKFKDKDMNKKNKKTKKTKRKRISHRKILMTTMSIKIK